MRRKVSTFAARAAALLALLPTPALAQDSIWGRLNNAACAAKFGPFQCSGLDPTTPGAGLRKVAFILGLFVGSLLAFLGVVFVLLMIQAGVRWMTARGNEQEVERAKNAIQHAAVGLLIVVLAYAFVTLVSTLVTNAGLIP